MTDNTSAGTAKKPSKPKPKPTRTTQLRKLLCRKSGATIAQIQNALGWQPHTARAAISRLRKTGTVVERQVNDRGSVYRIFTDGSRK
ncbi:MAG: DUF3489 domain-containing protein [Pseudomonadota bacterium]